MELRDYLLMLRRGWWAIALVAATTLSAAAVYCIVTPPSYGSLTVLMVSPNNPASVTDLQQGTAFATNAVITYAQIIDSVTVLGPAGQSLRPQIGVDELAGQVSATVRPNTTLIDVAVTGPDRDRVAAIANAVGAAAVNVIPRLEAPAGQTALIKVQQIRQAQEPQQALGPNVKRILVLGLLVGLLLGVALTIIVQTVDSRIRGLQDLREVTDLPVLAAIPPWPRKAAGATVTRTHENGVGTDAFRTLRANLEQRQGTWPRVLLVASAVDGRDGALVAAHLAWFLARTKGRGLVIDLDDRRAAVGEAFDLKAGRGLADVLRGEGTSDVVREVTSDLSVLLPGRQAEGEASTVDDAARIALIDDIARSYDFVILNAPYRHAEVAQLAQYADATLVCVPMGQSREQDVTRSVLVLDAAGVVPCGLVLTRSRASVFDAPPAVVGARR